MIEKLVIKTKEDVEKGLKNLGPLGSLIGTAFGEFEFRDYVANSENTDVELAKKINEMIDAINELEKRLEK